MTNPANELPPTQTYQTSFEFEKYIVRGMETVETQDVSSGDVVYFVTVSESTYILEIEDSESGYVSGLLSRRGNPVELKTGGTLSDLDGVSAKIYTDYEGLSLKRSALICPEDVENFKTSRIKQLMVVSFDPFKTKA